MISIYMIMTALVPTTQAKGTHLGSLACNLSKPMEGQQCFGAPGEPFTFHLPTNVTRMRLMKENSNILDAAKKVIIHEEYRNDSIFCFNGTFKLNNVERERDSGDYELATFDNNGIQLDKIKMHLEIQASVSKPVVSQMCLSPEQFNISCSSKGDGVQIMLTVDQTRDPGWSTNNETTDTQRNEVENGSNVSYVTISLESHQRGNVTCHVWNQVSQEKTITELKSCKAPVSKPAVSQLCLSPEQMNISCSSEGYEVQFTLTLDDYLLIQTNGHIQSQSNSTRNTSLAESTDKNNECTVSNVTIRLFGQLTGNLKCDVQNDVSREETVIRLKSCQGSISHLSPETVAVTACITTLLLHLVLFLGIKHFSKKKRLVTVNEENTSHEIIYSDVRLMRTRITTVNSVQSAT